MRRPLLLRAANRTRHEYGKLSRYIQRVLQRRQINQEFGSHIDVLKAVCGICRPQLTIEFGMGLNSTGLLLGQSDMLFSVEHNAKWYSRVVRRLPRPPCVLVPILWRDEHVEDMLELLADQRFDLALIDGPGRSRVKCAQRLLSRTRFLVLHDTEATCYDWEPLFDQFLQQDVHFFTSRKAIPWTTVVTSDLDDLQMIVQLLQGDEADVDQRYATFR